VLNHRLSICLLALLLLAFSAHAQTKKSKKPAPRKASVTINITQTTSYCGGAPPSEDMLQKLQTPQALNGVTFYIIKGNKVKPGVKPIATFTTDDFGKATVRLAPGNYSVISAEQLKSFAPKQDTQYDHWDKDCLYQQWLTPLLSFTIKSAKPTKQAANIHKPCFFSMPCNRYTGPIPS
jgi:hypothetical protein